MEKPDQSDSVPWKWWAKYQKFDEQNARVEVVNLFHFLISLAHVPGMGADDIFRAYPKKNEVNFQRRGAVTRGKTSTIRGTSDTRIARRRTEDH